MTTMKSGFKSLLISVAFFALPVCSATNSFSQSAVSVQVSASIVTPLAVAKLADLEFSYAPSRQVEAREANKQARLAARTERERCSAALANAVKAASFTVSGYANYAYGVTMPATVTKSIGNHVVTIGTTMSAASASYSLSDRGTDALSIAGTLSMACADSKAKTAVANSAPDADLDDQDFKAVEEFPVTIIYN